MAVSVSHLLRRRRGLCSQPIMHYALYILSFAVAILSSNVATSGKIQGLLSSNSGPKCLNITLPSDYYTIATNGDLYLKANQYLLAKNGTYTNDLTYVQTCYPVSQDFDQCQTEILLEEEYRVEANLTLTNFITGTNTELGNYFINNNGSAIVCEKQKRKIRKCNNLSLTSEEYTVLSLDSLFIIPRNETLLKVKFTIEPQSKIANVCYPLTPAFLSCKKWLLKRYEFVVLPDRSIYDKPHDEFISPGDYVIIGNDAGICINSAAVEQPWPSYLRILHGVPQVLSAIALAIAILIHLIFPDLSCQRSLLICHSFSFMIAYICLAVRNFYPFYHSPISGCLALFYISYYFITAAFCWLSILAFDIWRISAHLSKGTDGYRWVTNFYSKKFYLNCLFGWGIPLVLAILVAIVDSHESIQDHFELHPNIRDMCWFSGHLPPYVFFYGPMCVLLIVNFLLFALSIYNIWKASRYNEFTNMKFNNEL